MCVCVCDSEMLIWLSARALNWVCGPLADTRLRVQRAVGQEHRVKEEGGGREEEEGDGRWVAQETVIFSSSVLRGLLLYIRRFELLRSHSAPVPHQRRQQQQQQQRLRSQGNITRKKVHRDAAG